MTDSGTVMMGIAPGIGSERAALSSAAAPAANGAEKLVPSA